MRVEWEDHIDIPETYWENENFDPNDATIRREGKVIDTVHSFWGTYFIIKLKDGTFIKKDITEVKEVPYKCVLPKIDKDRIERYDK